jgi:NAD(P)-dependent dehydrogenase (short-subunit alcohol dehydrogenase family)
MSGRMQGKICLVTGATAGIGKATALGLARLDARVVIVGRDAGLTEETVKELRRESRNSQVESLVADLSSQAEVRRLAATFQQRYDK